MFSLYCLCCSSDQLIVAYVGDGCSMHDFSSTYLRSWAKKDNLHLITPVVQMLTIEDGNLIWIIGEHGGWTRSHGFDPKFFDIYKKNSGLKKNIEGKLSLHDNFSCSRLYTMRPTSIPWQFFLLKIICHDTYLYITMEISKTLNNWPRKTFKWLRSPMYCKQNGWMHAPKDYRLIFLIPDIYFISQ